MNGIQMGGEWFTLLRQLASTVDNPKEYIRYYPPKQHQGWRKLENLQLAYALLDNGATELVPGILQVLHSTSNSQERSGDYTKECQRRAAIDALSEIGKDAAPALHELQDIVRNEPDNARFAVLAIGNIGDPAATPVLAACFYRSDLEYWVKDEALIALRQIGKYAPEARDMLIDAMQSKDLAIRRRAAVALGCSGDPQAAPVLVALLSESVLYFKKEVSVALKCIVPLPPECVAQLRQLHEASLPDTSKYATWVLQDIELKSKVVNKRPDGSVTNVQNYQP